MKIDTMIEFKHTKIDVVTIIPHYGEDVNSCIAEAIYVSSELGCSVVLIHNGRPIKINADKITNKIYEKKLKERGDI